MKTPLTSVRGETEATAYVASHLAESGEGKNHLTGLEAISEPFLNLKIFVFDGVHDVLQKEKGKERKKEESRI